MPYKFSGLTAVIVATLIWAVSPIIFRIGLNEVPPYSFTFFRFLIAAAIMATLVPRHRDQLIHSRDLGKFIILGGLITVHIVLIMVGLTLTSVSTLAVMSALGPLVISAGSIYFLHERVSPRFYFGLTLAL